MPKQGTERRVTGGGGSAKPFREVTKEYRNGLLNQLTAVEEALSEPLKSVDAAPMRVTVISKASAKSHRPDKLFNENTCPIIGAGHFGELFVKATSVGLYSIRNHINQGDSDAIVKALSCIETISAITPKYRQRGETSKDILRRSPRSEDGFIVKVRLFEFDDENDQFSLSRDFKNKCQKRELSIHQRGYDKHSQVYSVECHNESDVDMLSRIVGVRSITSMPRMRIVKPKSISRKLLSDMPVREKSDKDYPVVVVVDSGITNVSSELDSWVIGRTEDVAPEYSNRDHGSFVAGLVCWGKQLNPDLPSNNSEPCAVYDLQVLPNDDPDRGSTDDLMESEFLESLESALIQHANKYKVWNLSLGTDEICSLDRFSELAEQLDNLQERYAVSFVVAAGNYETRPLLSYPRDGAQLDKGRITSPADSVLAITIGSITHTELSDDAPKKNDPSAFSRHGPGPNHIIKPDLVHYGGTCSHDGKSIKGIRSIVEDGSIVEELGTSFAAPLVSRSLAQIYHQVTPTPNPVLARALLTHHARDPQSGSRVPDGKENYIGFGRPEPVPYCLECSPYSATLIFDDVLRPGYFLEWDDFPYPQSLKREGRFFGEIRMTLAFSPTRGARWGTEYCESHIGAHLGVYHDQVSRKTGEVKQVFKGLVPPEHRNKGELYEEYQIERLRKWAPVRTYHGRMGEKGQRGNRWRLKLQLLTRHERPDADIPIKPQPFSLIVTIADPERKADVYDEVSRIVRNKYRAENLAIRQQTRIQPKT
jgi:hypothetical protein